MSLKIMQYSQEKTCVGVSFNKVAGLNQIQVFFCEYCNIFKNNFFIDHLSGVQQKEGEGMGEEASAALF